MFKALQYQKFIRYDNLPLRTKAGQLIQVEFVSNVYAVGSDKVIQCNIRNITDQKLAFDALQESEARLQRLIEFLPTVVYTNPVGNSGTTLFISQRIKTLMGYSVEAWLDDPKLWSKRLHPDDRQQVLFQAADADRRNEPFEMDYRMFARDGHLVWVHDHVVLVNHVKGLPIYRQGIMLDITEHKQSEMRIKRQLEHLTAVSAIDRVTASNFDIKLILTEILTHVTAELGVDAADILILNPDLQMLDFGAQRGFRNKAVGKMHLRVGESYAGRVALERRIIHIPDVGEEREDQFISDLEANEGFVCYFGVPLISKGHLKGVLEVFQRTMLEPDAEWLDFL